MLTAGTLLILAVVLAVAAIPYADAQEPTVTIESITIRTTSVDITFATSEANFTDFQARMIDGAGTGKAATKPSVPHKMRANNLIENATYYIQVKRTDQEWNATDLLISHLYIFPSNMSTPTPNPLAAMPPSFVLPPNDEGQTHISIPQSIPYNFTVNVTNPDNVPHRFRLAKVPAPPSGAMINDAGFFSWTPGESHENTTHNIAIELLPIRAQEDDIITKILRLYVQFVNDPPSAPDDSFEVDEDSGTTQFMPAISDPDRGDTAEITRVGGASRGNTTIINATTIGYTPYANDNGPDSFNYTVTDSGGLTATGTINITIASINDLPVITGLENTTIDEFELLDIQINLSDEDNSTAELNFTHRDAPEGMEITPDRLRWTPAEEQGGRPHTFVVAVSDGLDTVTQTVVITVNETNSDPVLEQIDDLRAAPGSTVAVPLKANDTDVPNQTLSYGFDGTVPAGAMINSTTNTFIWTPGQNQTGDHPITITVSDGNEGSASQTFTVTVSTVAAAPEPGRPNPDLVVPDILINAELHFPSAVTPAVADPAGGNVTITGVTGATLGSLDISMLPQISYTPNQTGIDILTYTVSDERNGTANATISIFISPEGNARPALDHIYNIGGRVGVGLNFTAAAADGEGDPLTFGLANAPDGAGITTGGDFSWRPSESENGTHTVTFIVYDDSGGADWQHVAVTILRENETNLPPVPQDIDAGVVLGGGRGFQPDIADPENDGTEIVRVYDSSLGDVDRSFTSQGIIVYVAGVLGSDEVIYTVSDGRGGFANGTISITVEEPANVRPLIEFVGDKSVNAGDELTFTVDADDLDGLVVDFGLEGDTQGPSMSPLGVFSWTPTANDVGRHQFTILVFDDAGENSTVSITVTVRPEDFENSPPVAPDVVIMTPQDVLSIVRPTLTDPDEGDPVRITQTGDTTKGSILSGFLRAGIIIYLPNQGETGTETIPYTIADSSDGNDTATINVFISARGNTDPILGSIYFRNINAGNPLGFDLEAEDPDGDTISYLLVGAPDNTAISSDGAFSWTPTAADVGNHTFTVIAYDDRGGADSKTAVIRVLPAGTANQAPNAPDSSVTVAAGGSVVIMPAISDPDGDRVTITDAVASGTGVVIYSEDSMNYIHVATTPTETITYTVTDARGAASTGTITVTVQ